MARLDPVTLRTYDIGLIAPGAAQDAVWDSIRTTPMAPARYKAQAHLFPRLLPIAELSRSQQAALCEAADARADNEDGPLIGTLVCGPATIKHHLTRALVIARPTATDRLLRFYDPRVYQHLRWMLSGDQHAWLLGEATEWAWPSRDGEWQTDTPADGADTQLAARYSSAQLAQFERIETIERAYQRLSASHPDSVTPENKAVAELDRILAEAMQQHGLSADRDLDVYVDHAMTVHPHIHEHPEMRARLTRVVRGQSYRGACRDLDDATLARYAEELNRRDTPHRAGATH